MRKICALLGGASLCNANGTTTGAPRGTAVPLFYRYRYQPHGSLVVITAPHSQNPCALDDESAGPPSGAADEAGAMIGGG